MNWLDDIGFQVAEAADGQGGIDKVLAQLAAQFRLKEIRRLLAENQQQP